MNLLLEGVGFAGFGTNVLGNLLLTYKNRHGWWVRIVSNGLWCAYAGTTQSWPIIANAVVFSAINVHGWWKWSKTNG